MEPSSSEAAFNFWATFNWLDIVLGLGLVASLFVGLGAGFYRQVAMIFSICVGVLVASQLTGPLSGAEFWQPVSEQLGERGGRAAAYGSIVLASVVVGLVLVFTFRSFFSRTLRFFDSLLGGVTGVTIGGLLFGATILGLCQWEDAPIHKTIRESFLGGYLSEGARYASQVFPPEFRHRVEASLGGKLPKLFADDDKPGEASESNANIVPASVKSDAGQVTPATATPKGDGASTPPSQGDAPKKSTEQRF